MAYNMPSIYKKLGNDSEESSCLKSADLVKKKNKNPPRGIFYRKCCDSVSKHKSHLES